MNVDNEKNPEQPLAVSSCKNPDCIRCRRYRYVQEQAQSKLSWILKDLVKNDAPAFSKLNQRIPAAILRPGTRNEGGNQPSPLQDPTVLMVPDLPSTEIVTDWHQNACRYLQEKSMRDVVFDALHSLSEESGQQSNSIESVEDSDWTVNDSSPDGDWRVFHILNQGVWSPFLLSQSESGNKSCRKLLELVWDIPGLLNDSLFGNVFVSKIYPGTSIEPHCGPTNLRHRLQFLLKLPDNLPSSASEQCATDELNSDKTPVLSLSVGRKKEITWNMENDTFVFDDSFIHSVTYRGDDSVAVDVEKSGDGRNCTQSPPQHAARIVLIVDLWHPHLQNMERMLIQHSYPPFDSSMW